MNKRELFKRILPYLKEEKGLIFVSLFLTVLTGVLSAFTPFVTKRILDIYLPNNRYDMIVVSLIIYAVAIVILSISKYFFQYYNTLTGMNIEKRIRDEAIKKINYLPVDYYSLEPDGKIVAKITSDTAGIRVFYTKMFTILNALINIVIIYIGIVIMQPILGPVILLVVPILVLWVTLYRRKVHKFFLDLRETGSRITGKLNEIISGALIIQDFNQEDEMLDEYEGLAMRYVKNDRLANTINIYFGFELLAFIKRATEIGLIFFLGYMFLSDKNVGASILSAGLVAALVENLDKMINPINMIFQNLNELEDSLVGSQRALHFLDEENDERVSDGLEFKSTIEGNVDFEGVKFAYVNDKYVLKDLSLHVKAGETIGIVGHTGSGKSTLMNLLLQFNDYKYGHVYVDGEEINLYNKDSYRKSIGIVLQTPALFRGTLKSNIALYNEISDEEAIEAIKAVGGEYMLKKSDRGIHMPISFRGENLSLGEKQLISFARILLTNPKIMVLDEATANIDSDTEMKIKAAMDVAKEGRTSFIIAHRLSTIKDADRIVVLDNGNIIGIGNHEYLYNTCLKYKDMHDSQFNKK